MDMLNSKDYSGMFGEGSPIGTWEQLKANDLTQMFQQQKLQQEQETARKMGLENMFAEQNNPLRLEHQRAQNEGLGYQNRVARVGANETEQLAPYMLDAKKQEAITKVSKAQMDDMEYKAQRMAYSPDSAIAAQGEALLKKHADFVKIREQARIAQEAATARQMFEAGQKDLDRKNQRQIAQMGIDGRIAAKQAGGGKAGGLDFWSSYYKNVRGAKNQHAALVAEATKLGQDDPQAQVMLQMAEALRPQAEAEIATPKPGSVNAGAMGNIPTNPGPQIAPRSVKDIGKKTGQTKNGVSYVIE